MYRPRKTTLLRQLVLISDSAENSLEKLPRIPRSRHSSRLSPHASIRGTHAEITRHDCLGIDRGLIIAPASFPSTIFSITQSSRPTATAAKARWLSMALHSPRFESRWSRWYQFEHRSTPRGINDIYTCLCFNYWRTANKTAMTSWCDMVSSSN